MRRRLVALAVASAACPWILAPGIIGDEKWSSHGVKRRRLGGCCSPSA